MSLLRLFQIPLGRKAEDGAYVAYPFELSLGIVAAESRAAGSVIVGEDLGTVPDGFRERMEAAAILSYRLLLFERDAEGRFLPPESYPKLSLATATTHDLPTLPGWVLGRDLDVRAAIGGFAPGELEAAHALRRVDASRLIEALATQGELDGETAETLHRRIDRRETGRAAYAPLVAAAYRFLAAGPARIVLVQLDDALGELDQVNLPGTSGEYPNWRRKYGLDVEEVATHAGVANLAAELRERIRGGSFA
jgi:4-alpha-glucanotransferase